VHGFKDDGFERLYAEHAQGLYAFLRYRTGDSILAEDLLADTCERVLRSRRRFDPRKGSAKTWFYAIALNCLHDHHRRRAGESKALEQVAAGALAASDYEEMDHFAELHFDELGGEGSLERGLATLSGPEREAVSLRYGAELTLPEIAKLTGEPLTTVESRVRRALEKLRDALS
jgi:RNA polymerase sigma-70 factor (ECF subfamily)